MRIVAGLLDSEQGRAALEAAIEHAEQPGATLHLVAYVPNPLNSTASKSYFDDRKRFQSWLDDELKRIRGRGVDCEGHLVVGASSPSEALLGVAESQAADLIVIGIRRRSRVGKLVLGSNAQDILMRAECPVLGVKH